MMEITLRLSDGQKKTFSEEELVAIVEEHLRNQKSQTKKETIEFAEVPTEGKWFTVNPLVIDKNLFKEKREILRQEETRQLIVEAFEEMKKNSRYARPFKTMIPEKTWGSKSIANLEKLANNLGGHCADWVEQALEWAQRIANGESWEDICNQIDNTNYFRLVVWKSGYLKFIGGSSKYDSYYPISHIGRDNYKDHIIISDAVPLVVSYDV